MIYIYLNIQLKNLIQHYIKYKLQRLFISNL